MLKKIFLVVLLLIAAPIFTGCGKVAVPTADEKPAAYENREGIIQPLGTSIYQQGTHRLEQDGKLVALIESAVPTIQLDNYLSKEVLLQGIVKPTVEGNLEIMSVVAVTPRNIGAISDQAVQIEQHSDPELGFAVNYPSLFVPHQTRSGVAIADGKDKILEVLLLKNEKKQDLLKWLVANYNYEEKTLTKISVAGLIGYQFQNTTGVVIYLARDTQVYTLAWYDNDPENRARNRRYYLEFVQSFTLIDTETAETTSDVTETIIDTTKNPAKEGEFCGGMAAIQCASGLQCRLDGDYPDSGGLCEAIAESTTPVASPAVSTTIINSNLPKLTAAELQRGWYYGDADGRKSGTPENWTLVGAGTRSAMWRRPESAPTETPTTLQNPNSTTEELSNNQKKVYDHLLKNISSIAPETPQTGSWKVVQVAFATPNYVYAIYTAGEQSRKLLLVYSVVGDTVNLESHAYFIPGETADWLTSEGKDSAYGKELIVVDASGATTKLLQNYNQYSNQTSGYRLQYPRSWYWRNTTTKKTEFSDKPFPAATVRIIVEEISGSNFTFGELQKVQNKSVIYLRLNTEKTLQLTSEPNDGGILQVMAQTFVAN